MKKILLLPFALLLSLFAIAQTPVAYYPFTGNANDAAGTNNGTVNGAVLTTDRFGNANSAYSFDGVDDFVSTANLATAQTDNWTITAWVKPSSISQNNGTIVLNGFDDGLTGNGYGMVMGDVTNSSPCNLFKGLLAGVVFVNSGFTFSTNNIWYHTAIVREVGITKLYFNGVLSGTTSAIAPNLPSGSLRIGSSTGLRFWNGSIDEVKIYNTALTAAQVQLQYNQTNYSSQFNNSVKMNGVNDNIAVPHSAAMQPGMFVTAECWAKSNTATWNDFGFLVNKENAFMIHPRQGVKTINFYAYNSTDLASTEFTPGASFDITKWHHYAGTYNGTTGQLNCYIDGVLVAQAVLAGGGSIRVNSNALFIGVDPCCPNRFFNGTLDEVRLWHTTRTQAEIVANMNQQLTGNEAGLVGYWDMNRNGQGAGLTVDNKCVATGVALNGTTLGTASTPIFAPGITQQKAGSGNAISFDGVDDFIEFGGGGGLNGLQSGTIEIWVKWNGTSQTANNAGTSIFGVLSGRQANAQFSNHIIGLDAANPNTAKVVWRPYNFTNNAIVSTQSPGNGWNHLVITYASGNHTMYLNGINVGTSSLTGSMGNNPSTPFTVATWLAQSSFANCEIDEVRIWNTTLTQSQIRDRMCRKITVTDALYPNLVAYYNFDESTGNTAFDGTANANNGTLTNSPTRVTSGAAIGNASSHDYVNVTKTTSLTHPTGESFTVTSTSGSPAGIQVYRVDEQPNTLSGAIGVGANDKYFGVFQVGGTLPQYTAVYNYNGNPGVNVGNENQLRLNKRSDNAAVSWSVMVDAPNEAANTITVIGESTEYILGKLGFALPINLISFTAIKQSINAILQWKIANEKSINKIEIQRSINAQPFTTVGSIKDNATTNFTDAAVFAQKTNALYRLKIVDNNGQITFSNIVQLTSNDAGIKTTFSPNPVKNILTINGLKQGGTLQVININGKIVYQQNVTIPTTTLNMSNYANGMYLLQYKNEDEIITQKIIKH